MFTLRHCIIHVVEDSLNCVLLNYCANAFPWPTVLCYPGVTNPSSLFSLHSGVWWHAWHCSACKVLFSVPFDLRHIASLFPVIKISIVWMYHNLFYYDVLFGCVSCFNFFTLVNNAGYLSVNEYLITSHIFLSES